MPLRAWLDDFIAREGARAAGQPAPDSLEASAVTDPMDGWGTARDAFGQRASRPEALQSAEAGQVSAAAILARAVDDADERGSFVAEPADAHAGGERLSHQLGVRARVSRTDANARRRLDIDEVERLLGMPAPQPDEIDGQPPLSEVERALREMREQMDAALQLSEAALPAAPSEPATAASAGGKASTEAIANLGSDIARLVEVMDCGFDRVEAASARQTLELRGEVSRMFDELATRIDAFERQPQGPEADGAQAMAADARAAEAAAQDAPLPAETVPASDEDPLQAIASLEVDDELAPIVNAGGGERHDDDEPPMWAVAPSLPTTDVANETPAETTLDAPNLEVIAAAPAIEAADDPLEEEIFENAPTPDVATASVPPSATAVDPVELPDWSQPAFSPEAEPEAASQPWQTATDDLDADLFVQPPELAREHAFRDPVVEEVHAVGADWPTSAASEPVVADRRDGEVWFGARSGETRQQAASDWWAATSGSGAFDTPTDREPWSEPSAAPPSGLDDDAATVERFDLLEPSVGEVADFTSAKRVKRSAFPWLPFRRAGQARKSA